MMQRVRWMLPRVGTKLGWAGLLGVLVIACSVMFLLLHVIPEGRSTSALELENVNDSQLQRLGGRHAPESPSNQLARFDALLPSLHDLPAVLARVHADAARHGVELSEGQFKLSIEPDTRIARYQISFPVKAGYAATREFVRNVMQDTPAMALEELSFERSDPKSSLANTRIQFVLYVLANDRGPS